MLKNSENNGTAEIGLVTPAPVITSIFDTTLLLSISQSSTENQELTWHHFVVTERCHNENLRYTSDNNTGIMNNPSFQCLVWYLLQEGR